MRLVKKSIQEGEKSYTRQSRKHLKLAILIIFASFCLSLSACTAYNPSLYPSYDVLNPGPEVTINPIRITDDGNFVVTDAFLMWVNELKTEVKRLRKETR